MTTAENNRKRVLILAPHADDELIGCWSVLTNPENLVDIYYFYDLTKERVQESRTLREYLPTIHNTTWTYGVLDDTIRSDLYSEIYVPSRRDGHEAHKKISVHYRMYATHFYSVDMHDAHYLGDEEAGKKKDLLNLVYPSQRALWETNAKYYLFESIHKLDYQDLVTLEQYGYKITIPRQFYADVRYYLTNLVDTGMLKNYTHKKVFNGILGVVPNGKVRLVSGTSVLETYE